MARRTTADAKTFNFSMKVKCSKLIVTPPHGERTRSVLSAELKEVASETAGRITIRDIDESAAEVLRQGLLDEKQYEITVGIKEIPNPQQDIDFEAEHADAH